MKKIIQSLKNQVETIDRNVVAMALIALLAGAGCVFVGHAVSERVYWALERQ